MSLPRVNLLMRRCPTCKTHLPWYDFHRSSRTGDGFHCQCKPCEKAYRLANRDAIAARKRAYDVANRERRSEYNRANSERQRAYWKWYRETFPDRVDQCNTAWRERNHDAILTKNRNRRAAERRAEGTHCHADVVNQFERQRGRCFWCHKTLSKGYHVDHVVPLCKGGTNSPENLVICCPRCNCSKRGTHPMDWVGVML
jgi:hypothetical protein